VNINQNLNNMDRTLNQAGVIPIVSTVTGAFRVAAGIVETVVGIAMGIFGVLGAIFKDDGLLKQSSDHALNGLMNVLRGSVEIVPVVGNCIMFLVNGSDVWMHGSKLLRGDM
jgi:hypothetical protein